MRSFPENLPKRKNWYRYRLFLLMLKNTVVTEITNFLEKSCLERHVIGENAENQSITGIIFFFVLKPTQVDC